MSQMMTVSSLNTKIKSLLEATFMHIMVEGEIAAVTYHSSGHVYFSIKDDKSTLRCVMWRSNAARLKFKLEQGEHIVIEGSIGVYMPRGEYQFIATHIEPYGKGTLAVAFEQLKKKLKAKGYFDPENKKPLPPFCNRIALVTAATGAALQDMLKVAKKRWPAVKISVIDVLVQGEQAAGEIARGIAYADTLGVDLIIAGRGGGSIEDLWPFNEEIVADAIHAANTPVVSAVGHEVDVLISDLVADLRAPTPSAAMEMVLPDRNEFLYMLDERRDQYRRRAAQLLAHKQDAFVRLRDEMVRASLASRLTELSRQFDRRAEELQTAMQYRLVQKASQIEPLQQKARQGMASQLHAKSSKATSLHEALLLQDPKKRVSFGWAQISMDGKRVDLNDLEAGEEFDLVNAEVKMRVKGLEKSKI